MNKGSTLDMLKKHTLSHINAYAGKVCMIYHIKIKHSCMGAYYAIVATILRRLLTAVATTAATV